MARHRQTCRVTLAMTKAGCLSWNAAPKWRKVPDEASSGALSHSSLPSSLIRTYTAVCVTAGLEPRHSDP